MVAAVIQPQRLSVRDGAEGGRDTSREWTPLQIATPIIVGVTLLLLFAIYIIWQRRAHDGKRSYGYHQVRSDWITKMERMFVPRRTRQRVLHSSAPVTLDDSLRTTSFMVDARHTSRQYRSDSSDSQTPLTSGSYLFDYPPVKPLDSPRNKLSESPPPPNAKRHTVRWWWLFGSRPQQVKSEEPNHRWRIDDLDGSSSGHGHNSHGHRYVRSMAPLHEDVEDGEDDVIRIGENFSSVTSTPMTQHFPDQARFVRGLQTVPENPQSGMQTPVPLVSAPRSNSGTPMSWTNRGLPPSYDISQNQRCPSTEDVARPARPGPYIPVPHAVRAAGSPSPHAFHGRELSSDSFLATQPPMVATSMY